MTSIFFRSSLGRKGRLLPPTTIILTSPQVMTLCFIPKNAFPLPTPITSKLVALGLDGKTVAMVSKAYLSAAHTLKATCEAEYTRACNAFLATSDDCGHSSRELRSKLLTVTVARYTEALSKWMEAAQKSKAPLLRREKMPSQIKVKTTTLREPSRKGGFEPPPRQEISSVIKPCPFDTTTPQYAFPHVYPPPVRPSSTTFVTQMPLSERRLEWEPKFKFDCDLDSCIAAFEKLSLEPSPPSRGSNKPSKTTHHPRSRTHATSKLKPTSQLLPSLPRLVSPVLDTSVAVSNGPLPKNTSPYSPSTIVPRSENVDIPRSNRRKACSIPYRRRTITPPESCSSSYPHSICRTPSLVSDHGSEASSPSTPPDFPSMSIPTSALAHRDPLHEPTSLLDQFLVPQSGWQGIDFGTDFYG